MMSTELTAELRAFTRDEVAALPNGSRYLAEARALYHASLGFDGPRRRCGAGWACRGKTWPDRDPRFFKGVDGADSWCRPCDHLRAAVYRTRRADV